jgi:radical SAM superfamily enzyme YgiQ (UPF0313 family)
MNALLVFPFSVIEWNNKFEEARIPLNITYLGAAARKAGHHVDLLDLRVEQQKRSFSMPVSLESDDVRLLTTLMAAKIAGNDVGIVGINCLYSGLFPAVIHLAKAVKALNSKIKVVIGGIHPTIYAKEILLQYNGIVDYVVIGEGESSFVGLLNCLDSRESSSLDTLDGFGYVKDNQVMIHPKNTFIENLDELPFPAVDLLNIQDYFTDTSGWHNPKSIPIKTPVPILTSRSCPKMCNFCSMHFVHGRKIRYRSPANVVEEMKMYINEYGLHYFNITDDNLTINKKRLLELMNLIVKENLNIQFSTENGVYLNTIDEEVLDAMSGAGLARLHMAFETGSDYIRNQVIGKNLSNKKIYEIKDILIKEKYNHIYLYGYFVIGLPEETEETLNDTYQLLTTFPLDNYSLFYAVPFPGTRLFEQCLRDRLFIKEYFYDTTMLVTQGDVGQMVKGTPNIKPYNLEIAALVAFKKKALDSLTEKRAKSQLPMSSPLRMKQPSPH